ncbi:MAG: hypothetical protein HY064_02100 [Bacteroidetes bacterium]|nr:hypothetical protein [Bacteroidota bacterium]
MLKEFNPKKSGPQNVPLLFFCRLTVQEDIKTGRNNSSHEWSLSGVPFSSFTLFHFRLQQDCLQGKKGYDEKAYITKEQNRDTYKIKNRYCAAMSRCIAGMAIFPGSLLRASYCPLSLLHERTSSRLRRT